MNALAAAYQRARALRCGSCARVPNGERVSCACTLLMAPLHLSLRANGLFAVCLGEKAYGGGGAMALHCILHSRFQIELEQLFRAEDVL